VNKMQNEIKQKNKPGCGKQARWVTTDVKTSYIV
jgi:hypothetical protein